MERNAIYKVIRKMKCGSFVLTSILLIFSSLCFSFFAVFGFGNSSIAAPEKQIFQIKNQYGQYIHVRYHLSQYLDSTRQSLVAPINSFNDYRIQEVGRNASFVSEQEHSILYNEKETKCNYLIYSDYYSEYYSLNRFGLFQGGYNSNDFNSLDTIYISLSIANQLSDSSAKNLIGTKILFDDTEFIIKGIIDESRYYDSPIHFSKLFGSMFVLFNSSHLKEYNFTDVFFESDDETFVYDSIELVAAFEKSYINYYGVSQSISSFKNENLNLDKNVVFSNPVSVKGIVVSAFSIVNSFLFGILFLILSAANKYQYRKAYMNFFIFGINVVSCSLPLFALLLSSHFVFYLSSVSIKASIIFLAISLIFSLIPFIKSHNQTTGDLHA